MRRTQLCWAALLLLQFAKTPTSATFQPEVPVATAAVSYDLTVARQQIIAAQFECYLKIINDPPNLSEGPLCNRTWDGWLCWEDSSPGTVVQLCPEYFRDFDPSEKVTKVCGRDGQWFRHPESNRIWSNYTQCSGHIKDKLQAAYNVYYLAIVGQGLSVVSLLISLWIFFYFKSLSCQRISLHKNMFLSFILNSICSVITLSVVTNNQPLIASNPMSCKVLSFLSSYALGSNYFWMLCEGIYLHTLIIVAVFAEEQQMHWYFILGWVFPLVPATIYTMARCFFYNDSCWISAQTHLLYIVHGPIYTALLTGHFYHLET
ncbi:calcitonin gene-related peptide type 1 receptor-like isoform X2 [Conger conger]|uniref:calcitonin gene-related peptide type 1 receptor-like isoform X2 n=1 Tax=Conger conger TaxID=82655 RepID=UPI002A5A0AEE|nr:calcitonin gene-related peptide type 1 receptor-like isoform X2 [Conger conger]